MNPSAETMSPSPPASAPRSAWHGLLFCALFVAAPTVHEFRVWPLFWIVPLAVYALLVAAVPPLRRSFRLSSFGEVSSRTVTATLIIAVVSCVTLVAFHYLGQPDLRPYRDLLPVRAFPNLFLLGALFSFFNALLEEVVFRGILFDAVASEWNSMSAVIATAALFGYGHLHGYPPGPLGAVLAGIYALGLGWLRLFTKGIGLPVMAHITADATIFTLLARSNAF